MAQTSSVKLWLPWLVAVALFMEHLDATILNTAVPTIAASLGVEPLSLKAVLSSYTLSLAVFIPISGWMADRFGTRRVFFGAIFVFLIGSLLCGLAVNLPMLVASRILQGIGGAMMTPVGRLALVRTFPRSEMITAMNYVALPALIGPLIGPSLGGVIVHWTHWRVIFFMNIPMALLGLWLTYRHMPDYREKSSPPLDRWGFLLFGSGIALLSYVLEVFGEHRIPLPTISLMALAAVALLGLYGWHARRTVTPLLSVGLLKIRTFRASVLGGFVTRLGIGGMPFLLPLLYQIGLGFAPWQAGLMTIPQALAAMGMKLCAKPILHRFGYRTTLIGNTLLIGVTISAFSLVNENTPIPVILALSLCQGFFSSLQFTCMNTLTFADVSDAQASKGSSMSSTAQQLSLSFGVAFASMLAEFFLGGVDQRISHQVLPALHHAFICMGVLTMVSSLVFATLSKTDGDVVSRRSTPEPVPVTH